jgi:hypothetical protein
MASADVCRQRGDASVLDRFARKIEERDLGNGVVEAVYEITGSPQP